MCEPFNVSLKALCKLQGLRDAPAGTCTITSKKRGRGRSLSHGAALGAVLADLLGLPRDGQEILGRIASSLCTGRAQNSNSPSVGAESCWDCEERGEG